MFIQLDEDFRVTSDPRNIILEKRSIIVSKEDDSVKTIWVNDGYYPEISSLLCGYLHKSIRLSAANTLDELAEDIKRIEKNIINYKGRD